MGQCKNHVKPNCDWLVKVFVFSGFRFSGGLYVQPPNKYRICSEPLHVEFFDKRHVLFTCIKLCKKSFSVLIDFILNESIFWTVEKQIFWLSRYLLSLLDMTAVECYVKLVVNLYLLASCCQNTCLVFTMTNDMKMIPAWLPQSLYHYSTSGQWRLQCYAVTLYFKTLNIKL